ncbi:hypothetical protein [Phenylobacterium sp.]|uniref:hypothetical protein n=1 Tax=Phenylobacterium sp. TaxID=1871053 RepID=UPI0035B16573
MRPRDVRAILFCAVTTLLLFVVSALIFHNWLVTLGLTGAWAAFVLTRPRMLRVMRRMRGEPDWSGYFRNDAAQGFEEPPARRPDEARSRL